MSTKTQKKKTLVTGSLISLLILFAIFMGGYIALFLVANHLNFIWPICHVIRVLDVTLGYFAGQPEMMAQGSFIILWAGLLVALVVVGIVKSAKNKRANAIIPMIAMGISFLAVVDVVACMTRDYKEFGGYVYLIAGTPDLPNEQINTARLLIGIGIIATAFIAAFIAIVAYGTALKDQAIERKANEIRKEKAAKLEDTLRTIVREELEAYFSAYKIEVNEEKPAEEPTEEPVEEPAPIIAEEVTEEPVEEPAPVATE